MAKIPNMMSELTLSSKFPSKIRQTTHTIVVVAILCLLASLYYMNSEMIKLERRCKDMETLIDLNSRTLIGVYQYLVDKEKLENIKKPTQLIDYQQVVKF